MTEAPQSIADRIAALKLNQVGLQGPPAYENATNGTNGRGRPPPPPVPVRPNLPARPELPARTQSSNIPPAQDYATVYNGGIHNLPEESQPDGRPTLPPRTSTQSSKTPALPPRNLTKSPALPPRTPSVDSRRPSDYSLARKDSNESVSSVATGRSSVSGISTGASDRVRVPAYDPTSLPPLPQKRTKAEKDAYYEKYHSATPKRPLKPTKSSPAVPQLPAANIPAVPSRPDARKSSLPARADGAQQRQIEPAPSPPPVRREIVPPPPKRSALSMGFGESKNTVEAVPPLPAAQPKPVIQVDGNGGPPPVPTGTRPDLNALQASKPKVNGVHAVPNAGSFGSCLLCRDYSSPDNHAAKFPRQTLPSTDIGWLAQQLTASFPTATDKARTLFTWLHHNIAYDTVAFFNNNVKPSTPQSTLDSGLAVCEGYAGLFAALAMKVGLEAVVISGHGKGFGYAELAPGSPLPTYSAGHAWNAVKIDGGQWKLIDCCWGAGAVGGKGQPYQKRFAPQRFTQSNDEFGLDHFPGDSTKQFRNDTRTMSWEEYITGNKNGSGAFFYDGYVAEEGLDKTTFRPAEKRICSSQQPDPTVRFSFQKVCPHWDPVRCGKGPYYLYILHLEGLDGTKRNHIPFQTNGDVWWCDAAVQDLGQPGKKARICVVCDFNGGSGRGLTVDRYKEMKGRCGMSFGFVCEWQID